MPLFKLQRSSQRRQLDVSMAGLKLGARVLQLGNDGELIAALARVVGISGEACAVTDDPDHAHQVTHTAAAAGVMVDVKTARFGALPYDAEVFDVLVIGDVIGEMRMNERVVCLQQALRVLRTNGRCLVVERAQRGGLGALVSRRTLDRSYRDNGGAAGALAAEGFRAVRLLAEREGKSYVEGTK